MPRLRKFPALAGMALALGVLAPAGTAPPPSPLDDLAWLTGTWLHEDESGGLMEETWSSPRADAMVGMFRMAQRGSVSLYELMSIELEGPAAGGPLIPGQDDKRGGAPQRLVLRLRHFQRGLVPWEAEKDGPLVFPAARMQANEAVFEDPARDFPRQVIYRREGDALTIRLVSGTAAREDLVFELRRSGG